MDEPMESTEPHSTNNVDGGSNDNDRRQPAQLLRPGSMGKGILWMTAPCSYFPKMISVLFQNTVITTL